MDENQVELELRYALERVATMVDRGERATALEILNLVSRGVAHSPLYLKGSSRHWRLLRWRHSIIVLQSFERAVATNKDVSVLVQLWEKEGQARTDVLGTPVARVGRAPR